MSQIVASRSSRSSCKAIIASGFLSSRRRHTRWNCDWSSDVCSSDLWYAVYVQTPGERMEHVDAATQRRISDSLALAQQLGGVALPFNGPRSEERRVGKERNSRWSLHPCRK